MYRNRGVFAGLYAPYRPGREVSPSEKQVGRSMAFRPGIIPSGQGPLFMSSCGCSCREVIGGCNRIKQAGFSFCNLQISAGITWETGFPEMSCKITQNRPVGFLADPSIRSQTKPGSGVTASPPITGRIGYLKIQPFFPFRCAPACFIEKTPWERCY